MSRRTRTAPAVIALLAFFALLAPAASAGTAPGCTECTPPDDTTSVPAAPPSGWFTSSVDVTFSGDDHGGSGLDHIDWRLNGGPVASAMPDSVLTLSADGTYTLVHDAVDVEGNDSGWSAPATIRIDKTKPTDTTTTPAGWQTGTVNVVVQGDDAGSGVALVYWKVDGAAVWSSGTSGSVVPISGDGHHTITTYVVDAAGNASPQTARTVDIDTVTPSDDTAVNGGWNTGDVTLDVKGSDADSGVGLVEWQIDAQAVQSQANADSKTITISAEGEHTLKTWVTDKVGHRSAVKTNVVRIDKTAPTFLNSPIDASWRSADYPIRLQVVDNGSHVDHIDVSIDGGIAASHQPDDVVTVQGHGTHTFDAVAHDLAGNSSTFSGTVKIDALAPQDTSPAVTGPVANHSTVQLSGTDADSGFSKIVWTLDGGSPQTSTTSPANVQLDGAGAHHLSYQISDKVGNTTSGTLDATVTATPDTTPPVDTTTTPSGWWTDAAHDPTVSVTGTDDYAIDHVEWIVDGGNLLSGPAGSTITFATDGIHLFDTRVKDTAGQYGSGGAGVGNWTTHQLKIDRTNPTDTTAVPAVTSSTTITLGATDATSGPASMQWSLTGPTAPTTTTVGGTVTLPEGNSTLWHRAIDVAGNRSAWVASPVTVDTADPTDTTAAAPSGWQPTSWIVTPSGSDVGSGVDRVEAKLDGQDVTAFPITIAGDGEHTLETRVVDNAGNDSGWRTQTVQIDANAPTDTTPAAPSGWRKTAWTVSPSATDAGSGIATVEWRLGTDPTVHDAAVDPSVTVAAEGATVLYTRASDNAGHTSAWREQTVRIDKTVPTVGLSCSAAWTTAASCVVTAAGGPSGLASLTFARSGSAAKAVTSGSRVAVTTEGAAPATLTAVDGAGNRAAVSRTVYVDSSAPSATLACAAAAAPTGYACHASAADAGSGVALLHWRLNGGAWQAIASGASFAVASGRVEVEAIDRVGLHRVVPAAQLAVRTPPADPKVRSRNVAVIKRGARLPDGLLGAFELRSVRNGSAPGQGSADVRPLSLGKGRFRVTIELVSGQLTAKRRRTVSFRHGGITPRMGVALTGITRKLSARLTVERRSGRHWKRVASATASLKP